jgi:stage II sporulation protein AA (anti-sigma F factor antagonist)
MEIVEEKLGTVLAVALRGRLDAQTSKAVEDRLLSLIESGEVRLVVDLEQLHYISSVGLRVLLLAAKRLRTANGAIAVCALQPTVQQVFEIAGFTGIFRIFPTRDAAVLAVA